MIFHYKNYEGQCEFDETEKLYFGRVLHTNDVITFQAETVEEAEHEFHESINIYLEWCENEGSEPNQPISSQSQNAAIY